MKVLDIMHRGVASVAPETSVIALARTMRDMDIGALPVTQGEHILGIVTDRDVALRAVAAGGDLSAILARDVMTRDVVCCHAGENAHQALRTMERRKVRRMPVVNDDERLVGMISLGDIAHAHRPDFTDEVMQAVSDHHPEAGAEGPRGSRSDLQNVRGPSGPVSGGTKEPIRVTRAFGRAVARVRGDHPRRGRKNGLLLMLACDLGLILAGILLLAGLVLIAVGLVPSFSLPRLLIGVGLGALSVVVLVIWERVFWEPFAHKLAQLS